MREVDVYCPLMFDGKEQDAHVFGRCFTDMTGRITCQVEKVLIQHVDVYSDVPQDDLPKMQVRLVSEYIRTRHPKGHGEDAAV